MVIMLAENALAPEGDSVQPKLLVEFVMELMGTLLTVTIQQLREVLSSPEPQLLQGLRGISCFLVLPLSFYTK